MVEKGHFVQGPHAVLLDWVKLPKVWLARVLFYGDDRRHKTALFATGGWQVHSWYITPWPS